MHLPSLTLRPRLRAATLTLAALLAAAACGNKATSEAEVPDVPNVPVTGRVTDPNGLPLANVAVSAGNGAASATTDADGRYALGVAAAKLSPQAVRFTAAKYATVGRRLGQQSATLDVVMRPYDVVQSIELPTGDANAVAATSVRGDGTLTLSIPSDSMVTAAGTPARGPAEVRLTYWNPMQDLAQAPASLATALSDEPNAPVLSLRTLGMASIEVAQGNDLLQVAPGRTLQLDHLLPEAFKLAMAQRPNDSLFVPYLFSYDMNTGPCPRRS